MPAPRKPSSGPSSRPPGDLADTKATAVLAPSLAAAFLNCGVDHLKEGLISAAVSDFDEAIRIDPTLARAWCLRGYAHIIRLAWPAALADILRALEIGLPVPFEDSARLRLWIARSRQGDPAAASRELNQYFSRRITPAPAAWTLRVAALLGDAIPENEFFESLPHISPPGSATYGCEAHYFAGMKRLVLGDRKGAARAFENALATGGRSVSAWACAQAELIVLRRSTGP